MEVPLLRWDMWGRRRKFGGKHKECSFESTEFKMLSRRFTIFISYFC